MDIKEFVRALPKAELHVHLEGCLTPSLVATLADRNHMDVPESVKKASTDNGFVFHDLNSLMAVYFPAMSVLQTKQDFHDLAWDYLTKAKLQNVRHAELFFDPQAHTSRSIPISTVIEGYYAAVERAKSELQISVALILCFLREMSAESAMQTLEDALPYREKFVGIGLDGDERNNPPSKFAKVYQLASKHGLRLTAHCDIDEQNTLTHINEALHVLQVERIDHGTKIMGSPEMTKYIIDNNIGLTCCPISNTIVMPEAKASEMVDLLKQGVKITINSDDPGYFRGYINENFELLMDKQQQISRDELIRLVRNSFEISWLPNHDKDRYIKELDDLVHNASDNTT